jgi:hypothetical protein
VQCQMIKSKVQIKAKVQMNDKIQMLKRISRLKPFLPCRQLYLFELWHSFGF